MMKNGKFQRRGAAKRGAGKSIAVLLVLVLVLGCAIGGTIAWLTAKTPEVKNTFTVGDVTITLKESPLNADGTYGTPAENVTNTYQLIPGTTYTKDPVVAVDATSEDCYLFVKFVEDKNPSAYLTYTSTLTAANGWTQGDGKDIPANVWYREVSKSDSTRSWELLNGNTITVKDTVVKAGTATTGTTNVEMPAADKTPSLTYTAYAIQKANTGTAAEAWAKIPNK